MAGKALLYRLLGEHPESSVPIFTFIIAEAMTIFMDYFPIVSARFSMENCRVVLHTPEMGEIETIVT